MNKPMGASVRIGGSGGLGGELGDQARALLELEALTLVEAAGMLRGGRRVPHTRAASAGHLGG